MELEFDTWNALGVGTRLKARGDGSIGIVTKKVGCDLTIEWTGDSTPTKPFIKEYDMSSMTPGKAWKIIVDKKEDKKGNTIRGNKTISKKDLIELVMSGMRLGYRIGKSNDNKEIGQDSNDRILATEVVDQYIKK